MKFTVDADEDLPTSVPRLGPLLMRRDKLYATHGAGDHSAIVDEPRETFWRAFIPALGTLFFVINNLDKETGLINLSYGGDPQEFVDCGGVSSQVYWKTDEFPGALPNRKYDILNGYGVYWANRQLSLDRRMNVIVQEIDPQKSSVSHSQCPIPRQPADRHRLGRLHILQHLRLGCLQLW